MLYLFANPYETFYRCLLAVITFALSKVYQEQWRKIKQWANVAIPD